LQTLTIKVSTRYDISINPLYRRYFGELGPNLFILSIFKSKLIDPLLIYIRANAN